jgi:pyrrolysyl-tRNA synthetase-like protein
MTASRKINSISKRYYRKRVELFRLIEKIKLWPSRRGLLHGIKSIEKVGDQAWITTHCRKSFLVGNSRNSRSARWLRNKWFKGTCRECRVPDWKLDKYASTEFKRHYGSDLKQQEEG